MTDHVSESGLAASVAAGDPKALARAISLVEGELPEGESILAELFPRTGGADVIGVTGPPGVGKSTLVSRLEPSIVPETTHWVWSPSIRAAPSAAGRFSGIV